MVAQDYESTQTHRIVHLNKTMFMANKWYLNLKKLFWSLSAEDEGSTSCQGTKIPITLHMIPTCHRMFSNTPEVWSFPEADRKPSSLVRAQPFLMFRSHRRAMSVLMQENWSSWSKAPSAKRTKKEFLWESYRKKVHQRIDNNSDH